jgi:hypothetical protein
MLLLFQWMTNGLRSELGGGAPALIGGGAPTAFWFGGRPSLPLDELAAGPAARSHGGWSVNRHFLWRLLQPPNHLAGGSRALRPRHYRRYKRWLQGLPPFEAAAGSCRQFNRRFEATFDKVWNGYLFLKNHRKLNIKKFRTRWPPRPCLAPRRYAAGRPPTSRRSSWKCFFNSKNVGYENVGENILEKCWIKCFLWKNVGSTLFQKKCWLNFVWKMMVQLLFEKYFNIF